MTASYDKMVIDNEILGMVMRAVDGIRVNDETLAFDLIKEAGPGGHFVASSHTRRHMRTEQHLAQLSDRADRPEWQAEGAKDTKARATEKVLEILGSPSRSFVPDAIREQFKKEIPGIIDV